MSNFRIRLAFHGDLGFFLRPKTGTGTLERQLVEKSSVKDIIESCGVPHPEVDLILVNGKPVDFSFRLDRDETVDVYPIGEESGLFPEKRLQTREVQNFIADGHLGKLVRDLRLLGISVWYDRDADDQQLIAQIKRGVFKWHRPLADEFTKEHRQDADATSESIGAHQPVVRRALLTRDRRLLMHSVVRHGYYLRSKNPVEQTLEVLRRFDLNAAIDPFARCLRCNSPLEKATKAEVIQKLEPLTKVYYEQFRRCAGCGQVYWAGSHFAKLERRIQEIRARLQGTEPPPDA